MGKDEKEEYRKSVNFCRSADFGRHCGNCIHRSSLIVPQSPGTGCYLFDAFIGDTQHQTEFGWMGAEPIQGTICDSYERKV